MTLTPKILIPLLFCFIALPCDAQATAEQRQADRESANPQAPAQVQDPPKLTPAEQIDKLQLPENPTRAQCEAFIAELRVLVVKRGTFNFRNDTAITKLNSIPVEHISLLVQIVYNRFAPENFKNFGYFARHAIKRYDPESYRKIAIDGLAEDPSFMLLIAENGWYEAAKDTIITRLEKTEPFTDLPMYWFQAFVEVAEPEHHELLHRMALNFNVSSARTVTAKLSLLERLEGYDFAYTANACWAKIAPELGKTRSSYLKEIISPIVIRSGNIDAMAYAVEQTINPDGGMRNTDFNTHLSNINTPDYLIRRHLDFRGTHQEIADWFNANREKLVFDRFTQRFVIPEDF